MKNALYLDHINTDKPLLNNTDLLKCRILRNNGCDLLDVEILELILRKVMPKKNTSLFSSILIHRFGSFAETITAPTHLLSEINGINKTVIAEFNLIKQAAIRIAHNKCIQKPILNNTKAILEYINVLIGYEQKEVFHIMFLDKKYRLLQDERHSEGTIDHTQVYIRETIKRALELSASKLILIHNHPSGNPEPSYEDVLITNKLIEAASLFQIEIVDHLIFGKFGHTSLMKSKFIKKTN